MRFRSHQQFLRGSGWETGRDAKYVKNFVNNMFDENSMQKGQLTGYIDGNRNNNKVHKIRWRHTQSIGFDASIDSSFIDICKNFLKGYFPDLTDDQLVDVLYDPDRIPNLLAERGYDDEEIKNCFPSTYPGKMVKSDFSSKQHQFKNRAHTVFSLSNTRCIG